MFCVTVYFVTTGRQAWLKTEKSHKEDLNMQVISLHSDLIVQK